MLFPTLFLFFLISVCQAQSETCNICQLIVSYTEKLVQDNQTEQAILTQLDNLCSSIPVFGAACTSIVNQYAPQLITWLVNKENPAVFCNQVGLCASLKVRPSRHSQVKAKRAEEQSGVCSICQMVMNYVEHWVSSNQTEAQIIQQLESFCTVLGPLSAECNTLVATYAPQMIEWIEKNENPAAFCAQVGACTSRTQVLKRLPGIRQLPKRNKREVVEVVEVVEETQGALCQVCQLVMTYVEQLVAQNNSISAIEVELDQLCTNLPNPLSGMCISVVNQYVPQMVQWVLQKEPPATFCASVGLCSSQVNQKLANHETKH